jgi:hypothetical protein
MGSQSSFLALSLSCIVLLCKQPFLISFRMGSIKIVKMYSWAVGCRDVDGTMYPVVEDNDRSGSGEGAAFLA